LGEANLSASDRPRRVRSANVDEHLLSALGVRAIDGRLFAKGETDNAGAPSTAGPPPQPPPIAIVSYDLWQSAFAGQPVVGHDVEVNGRAVQIIGVMEPGADLMDNHTEIWLPLGLNRANRQNRSAHYLYVIGRLKDGITPESAQTELNGLIEHWGDHTGGP